MRKGVLVALALIFLIGLAVSAQAATYTFTSNDGSGVPNDFFDLDHGKYYTWGENWNIPANEVITGATLFFDNIRNWDTRSNDLWVHLLDSVSLGVSVGSDNQGGGDYFANVYSGDNILLHHWEDLSDQAQDITYYFSASELVVLTAYLADGNFGFGLDPDCHFYNDGVTFTITTDMSAVPVPAAVWLFGSGLIGLAGIRKKFMN